MSIFPRPLKKVLDKIVPFSVNDLIPTFNLGTGTADNTTFLRGDGTWASPGSSGGGIQHGIASGTDTYTTTISGVTSYADGDAYLIRFTVGNTTGCTLNINTLGAKALYRNNDGPLIGGDILDGAEMLCIYNSTLDAFQAIGTSPNTLLAYVTNAESITITKGQPVYAYGGTGDRLKVKLAYNTGDSTSAQTVGIVLSTSIGANQKGFIVVNGLLDGLSTLPTSTFADGDPIYLGATAGTITNVKPHAPNHLVYLGFVTTASPGSAGRMYVRVQNGYEMDELHDVQVGSYGTKDVLWRDTATNLWKNKDIFVLIGPASSSVDGYLTATDHVYFSGKQNAITTGTTSQYFRGDLSLATFPTIPTVTPSALTKVDDTNVTLTLGGTPSTSLLQPVSLTLGWTGTLADSRIASASNWNTAYTNRITSLTTTGSSGASTLSSNTLNIPNYTLAGLGGVPTTRTLTINGTTQDLSADRTFTITDPLGFTSIIKSANQDVTNSATFVDDTDLQFSVVAGGMYIVEMQLIYSGNNLTADYKWQFLVTSGTITGRGIYLGYTVGSSSTASPITASAASNITAVALGVVETNVAQPITCTINYTFTASANATFKFQFANNTATASAISRTNKGTYLKYKKIN